MGGVARPRAYTVVYDGDCRVCRRVIERLRGWDRHGKLELVPSQAPGVAARFPWIAPTALTESMQVVRASDGRTWQGAAAIERLLDILPRGRWIAWMFRVPLARGIAERLYRWFAGNRYRMGCGEHCRPHPGHGSE
ncbi:MAG: thiol-disulfide oxidoreductase DCC family protein [Gemmatimonadaceae bacterium]